MPTPVRRVVVGVGADGKSRVVEDGPATAVLGDDETPVILVELWKTAEAPAENSAKSPSGHDGDGFVDPVAGPIRIMPDTEVGSLFRICEVPPKSQVTKSWGDALAAMGQDDTGSSEEKPADSGYHATASIDYIVMLEGEITCQFEDGEVTLHAGDTLVQRSTAHAWENRGDTTARYTSILVGAKPR